MQEERSLLLLATGRVLWLSPSPPFLKTPGLESRESMPRLREAVRCEQLRAERRSLEHELEQKRFFTKAAMNQMHEAEHQSQIASSFWPQVGVSLEPSIRKIQKACRKEMKAMQPEGHDANSLDLEAEDLRQALQYVGESFQRHAAEAEDPKQGFWKRGVAELVGQALLLLGSIKDSTVQIRCQEMAIEEALHRKSVPEILEELQSVDLQAQEVWNEAKSSAAMFQLQQVAAKQSSTVREIADAQGELRQLKLQNEVLSDRKAQVSKALSSLKARQQNLLAEELKTDEVGDVSLLKALQSGESPTQQVLAAILEAIARAQWLAIRSEMATHTWKSLAHTLAPTPLPVLPSEASEVKASTFRSDRQDQLEASVSALTRQVHRGMAECEKCELESQTFEATMAEQLEVAEKKSQAEAAQQLDVWRKKLFETCTTLLRDPNWQTAACAEVQELGLESQVAELAAMNQRAQDRITVLSSHYANLHSTYMGRYHLGDGEPFYSRQQVQEIKSQLKHVRKELQATRGQCERLEANRPKSKGGEEAAQIAKIDLEQVCSAVTSMAERVEQMCEGHTSRSEGQLVLQELANSKQWCEEVQEELVQSELSEDLGHKDRSFGAVSAGESFDSQRPCDFLSERW